MAVTLGLLMVLFAVYLLWWTNHTAQDRARDEVHRLERQWAVETAPDRERHTTRPEEASSGGGAPADRAQGTGGGGPAAAPARRHGPARSESFAIVRIPRIGLAAPIAEGIDKRDVLDRGFVGHYPGTALPGETGNVALAAHRNTHGEPFRHLDRVGPGDTVTITTATGEFRYRVDVVLPQTTSEDGATIQPVPTTAYAGAGKRIGYQKPGRYLTLTTCTPEYSTRYRLVVWGRLLDD
ncbi:class E sortase [Streptomyces malaysiensis]|uniref:Class E sortase n=1 Tax=Streptomyces malaysiensis subsp. samsunensis TaxID=459658 RepID=A0A9X2M606_STRMQ|nr:class E sortase [Streptomyces samsunensis]MCQ8835779.1 class E sortase [Streptomyces samsunensis]